MQRSASSADRVNTLVAGGGFVGLSLAIALKQALGEAFRVVVADPTFGSAGGGDGRASAIAAGARRLFEAIGVWRAVESEAQPMLDMIITDSRLRDTVRPVFLTFGGEIEPGEPFAHMIENRHLIDALIARAREDGVVLRAATVESFDSAKAQVEARLAGNETLSAQLLVAADGARSRLRELAGIPVYGWSYDQSGIVATIKHERDHGGRAEEHFLPSGPFAILPLKGKRSSIVWTEETRAAERIVALPPELFHHELERRFGLHLGEIRVADRPRAYPLSLFIARSFIGERLALVGDAAHVIHPIAGQGLNMGLRDVAALAECITDAVRVGLDPGGADVLERYQRWRRFDTMTMSLATDGLNRLFSNKSDLLRLVRDVGLGLVERLPTLKRVFIREAAGVTGEVPKLLRGEAL